MKTERTPKEVKPEEHTLQASRTSAPADIRHKRESELWIEAHEAFDAFTRTAPAESKPSENEMIIFKELFRHCIGDQESSMKLPCAEELECAAMPRLEGFYQLVKDNPRIAPLSKAVRDMLVSYELLSLACQEVERF